MINNDPITKELLEEKLAGLAGRLSLEYFDTIGSTNNYLKENHDKLPHFHVAVASNQTAGRGSKGRSFFSPGETGVYISILLKDGLTPQDAELLTTSAAVAACRSLVNSLRCRPQIKWINDIYIDNRKVSGILTEGALKDGKPEYSVVGIGFNVYPPNGGFPDDIKDRAGAITKIATKGLRTSIAAGFIKEFHEIFSSKDTDYIDEYKRLNFLPG
ncbi:MAG: biotin--[acetyl-CoA-carboxylase] ligase, partial [Lachnospiraceae bacterium]|nr:biotin--[acetyl-CoA-carboxylase] ligase [Lachnospiraceae bacterium]